MNIKVHMVANQHGIVNKIKHIGQYFLKSESLGNIFISWVMDADAFRWDRVL